MEREQFCPNSAKIEKFKVKEDINMESAVKSNSDQSPYFSTPLPKIEKFTEEELKEFEAVFQGGDYPF